MSKYKLDIKLKDKPNRDFYIINKDSKFYCGLFGGDILWSDDASEAKIFDTPSKINALKRWKAKEKLEMVFTDSY